MKKLALICLVMTASAAHAHDSFVPHTHPHGASVLPDLYAMLGAAALIALGAFALRVFKRG
jgi:hypothetical protein